MNCNTNILFIGALDYNNIPKHGDSIKNQYLMDFFRKYRTVKYIDTTNWKQKPWLMAKLLRWVAFGKFDSIVYSVSNESAYKLTRLFTSIPHRKKLIYFMIGGYTPIKIAQGIYKAEPFKKLDRIIVEADRVCTFYEEVGVNNSLRVYNFKPYTYIPNVSVAHSGTVKFVFLSRLTELKGVFLIMEAIKKLNSLGYKDKFIVDYYGAIMPEIETRFLAEIRNYPNAKYRGFLNLKEESNYSILAEYDAMLFPTMHPTEGFPGVIADAAIAGVPVIAANWNYAEELVGKPNCGYIIPVGDTDALVEKMKYVIDNRSVNETLRPICVKQAETYKMENVLTEELLNKIGI